MKIIKNQILAKNGQGFVLIQPEQADDMWHLYNLISNGDKIRSSTYRNVVRTSNTGSTVKNRVKLNLCIAVEKVEYDNEECSLRITGKNVEENEHVKLGQYHTIAVDINQKIRIDKEAWDTIHLDRIKEAADPCAKADVAAVVMQEGLAHVCLVMPSVTVTKARIERRMPKKGQLNQGHSKAMAKFFEDIYEAINKHIDFTVIRCVLVGSPGFLKDDFMDFLNDTARRRGNVSMIQNKSKFLKVHATSGHKNAIEQALMCDSVKSQLLDVKAVAEVRALDRFYEMLAVDENRAAYGFAAVKYADENMAIDELLVTDKLFQNAPADVRKKYVSLFESVQEHGGKVYTFSSMHVSGEQLDQYTGIAATLRFPLIQSNDLLECDDDSSSDSSSEDDLVLDDDDNFNQSSTMQYGANDFRRRLSSADETELEGYDINLDGFI